MPEPVSASTEHHPPQTLAPSSSELTAPGDDGLASRFGAAAHLWDRLDTRPLEQRLRRRPWWRIWRQ